jgi:L-amino acid N-acyltransferase YncA
MRLIVRQLAKEDYKSYRKLFDEAYYEYLEGLKQSNLQKYRKELQDRRRVTSSRFDFYVKTGSSFVAEKDGEVVGYVATQTIPFMRGYDRVLWIEYVVVRSRFKRQGIGTALLCRLVQYAKAGNIDQIFSTINPDNEASIELHRKLGFNVRNWKAASLKVTQEKEKGEQGSTDVTGLFALLPFLDCAYSRYAYDST